MNTHQWLLLAVSGTLAVSSAVSTGNEVSSNNLSVLRVLSSAAKFTLSVLGIVTALLWRAP